MDDRERAKRNRPSIFLLIGVMVPTFLLLNQVLDLSVNWSFLIGLLLAVAINIAIKRPWEEADSDWPGQRDEEQDRRR